MKSFFMLLAFLLSCAMISCESQDDSKETLSNVEDGWVDPHEMVDEQEAGLGNWIKKSIDSKGTLDKKNSETAIKDAFANIQDELTNCKMKLESKDVSSCDTPYFKQLVRVVHEATSDVNPHTEISLSVEHRETLRKFLKDKANVHDVMAILLDSINKRTISDSFMDRYVVFILSFLNIETIVLLTFLIILIFTTILFEMTTRLTARQQFGYLLVVSFIISIPWEWYRLYKKAFANKQSIMMESLQKHCHTDHQLGPIESFGLWWKSSFSTVDSSCAKYQEALFVDAIWEVAPSMAVSATLTRFLVQPLEHIADATGKSFRALFQHLPIQWQPLMFLACLLVIALFLVTVSGFRISTPFLQIGVGGEPVAKNQQLLGIENQLQGLLKIAENQNVQVPAIENVGDGDERMQAVLDITRATNERSQQQTTQLREMSNSIQELRRREGHCRPPEAVEHPGSEVVDGDRVPVEASDPVKASDPHPT